MNTLIHNLENGFTKLTIKKADSNKSELVNVNNDSLLLPMNSNKITTLVLCNCNLTELPEWFTFENLKELDLSENNLESVPYLVYANRKIQKLNISNNKITNFEMNPKCSSYLQDLNLSNNCLNNIPSWICSANCDDLETLKLSNNPFEYQYQLLGRYLKRLKSLELNNSNVRLNDNKNRFLIEIPKLEQLFLSNVVVNKNINFIKELEFRNFAFVPYLKELHLIGLGISIIPEEFIVFKCLEVLNLHKNYISWFPSNFTQLTSLKVLIVSQNELLSLPRDINKLKHLEKLFISDNSVGSLPPSIKELERLQTLDCYNNDFTEDITEIIKCIQSLVAFDCEKNSFEINDDIYIKKRDKLRTGNGFVNRLNGPKILDLIDDSDNDKYYESSSDYSGNSLHESWEEPEPENWDEDSENSISDDMDLILPKYRFIIRKKTKIPNASDYIDPVYFEDAEYPV